MKKSEMRMGIVKNIQKIKNSIALEDLYQLTGILSRQFDDKEFAALTDEEWDKASIISSAMKMSDPKRLGSIKIFCRSFNCK